MSGGKSNYSKYCFHLKTGILQHKLKLKKSYLSNIHKLLPRTSGEITVANGIFCSVCFYFSIGRSKFINFYLLSNVRNVDGRFKLAPKLTYVYHNTYMILCIAYPTCAHYVRPKPSRILRYGNICLLH